MSNTLFSLTLELARLLMDVVDGTATGGSATTLVDSGLGSLRPNLADDRYNYGTIWVRSGDNANKSRTITDFGYSGTTGTFTFATMTTLCASTNLYSATFSTYPRDVLQRAVNSALMEIPPIWQYDTSTTTVADQMSYSLPAGVAGDQLLRVEIADSTTSPYWYVEHHDWDYDATYLYFKARSVPQTTSHIIRLMYAERPSTLTADSDVASDLYNPALIAWRAAALSFQQRVSMTDGQDQHAVAMLNRAEQKAQMYERQFLDDFPIPRPAVKYRTFSTGRSTPEYTGTVTP